MKKISEIKAVRLSVVKSDPLALLIVALGVVPSGGWTSAQLIPYYYVMPPLDGFWDFDFVASAPSGPATDVLTPIFASYTWNNFPADSLNGVTVHGSQNSVRQPFPSPFLEGGGGTEPWPSPAAGGDDPWPW